MNLEKVKHKFEVGKIGKWICDRKQNSWLYIFKFLKKMIKQHAQCYNTSLLVKSRV